MSSINGFSNRVDLDTQLENLEKTLTAAKRAWAFGSIQAKVDNAASEIKALGKGITEDTPYKSKSPQNLRETIKKINTTIKEINSSKWNKLLIFLFSCFGKTIQPLSEIQLREVPKPAVHQSAHKPSGSPNQHARSAEPKLQKDFPSQPKYAEPKPHPQSHLRSERPVAASQSRESASKTDEAILNELTGNNKIPKEWQPVLQSLVKIGVINNWQISRNMVINYDRLATITGSNISDKNSYKGDGEDQELNHKITHTYRRIYLLLHPDKLNKLNLDSNNPVEQAQLEFLVKVRDFLGNSFDSAKKNMKRKYEAPREEPIANEPHQEKVHNEQEEQLPRNQQQEIQLLLQAGNEENREQVANPAPPLDHRQRFELQVGEITISEPEEDDIEHWMEPQEMYATPYDSSIARSGKPFIAICKSKIEQVKAKDEQGFEVIENIEVYPDLSLNHVRRAAHAYRENYKNTHQRNEMDKVFKQLPIDTQFYIYCELLRQKTRGKDKVQPMQNHIKELILQYEPKAETWNEFKSFLWKSYDTEGLEGQPEEALVQKACENLMKSMVEQGLWR